MKCPYCAEEIKDEAIKCRYCGEWMTKKSMPEEAVGHNGYVKEELKEEKFGKKVHFPKEGNPIILSEDVIVRTDLIEYKKSKYTFDLVRHVGFSWTKNYMNYIPQGSNIELEFIITNFKDFYDPIKIFEYSAFTFKGKKIMAVYSAFLYLSAVSFNYRYLEYLNSIQEKEYFSYSDHRFHVDGTIYDAGKGEWNIQDGKLFRCPGALILQTDPGKFRGLFGAKQVQFSTYWDSDVFYTLLRTLYGITSIAPGSKQVRE